jgi:bacteriocin-like protein
MTSNTQSQDNRILTDDELNTVTGGTGKTPTRESEHYATDAPAGPIPLPYPNSDAQRT